MKKINYLLVLLTALSFTLACKNVSFRKTKSGLVYKIFPGKGKDSLIRDGQVVKFSYTIKYNDSLMDRFNSYDKVPGYVKMQPMDRPSYDFVEILPMMKKGDSAVTVQMADSIFKSYQQLTQILPPHAKKGDRLTMTIKVTNVFSVDSTAIADAKKENERDRPRQMKEQQKEMARMQKEQEQQNKERQLAQDKEIADLERSGEVAKELKEMETYLSAKKIKAQKTGKGTYVYIKEQGTGPEAAEGKYVNIKYTGKFLATDSSFQSNSYAFQLGPGKGGPIRGWQEGLLLFKKGGKGTLFIPGFLAYGKNPPQGSPFKPFEGLKFDIEVLDVSDNPIAQ